MAGTFVLAAALALAAQDTDTVFAADGATRLDLEGASGEIVVRSWTQDQVRIQADHSRRTEIEVRRRGTTLYVEAEGRTWTALADFVITVPRGMEISVEGFNADVDIEGVGGAVGISTIQGDARVVGAIGDVSVETVNGRIELMDVDGEVEASSPSGSIRVVGARGELRVEAVGGGVELEGMDADVVDVSSVGGRIRFTGALRPNGEYYFGTHGGTISLEIEGSPDAEFNLASVMGRVRTQFPGAPEPDRRNRLRFTTGAGSAVVDAETYGGTISLRRAGGGEG